MSDREPEKTNPRGDWSDVFGAAMDQSGGPANACSLRDYFAGQALPQCVAVVIGIETGGGTLVKEATDAAAELAYQIADAMLKAREAK